MKKINGQDPTLDVHVGPTKRIDVSRRKFKEKKNENDVFYFSPAKPAFSIVPARRGGPSLAADPPLLRKQPPPPCEHQLSFFFPCRPRCMLLLFA